MSSKMLFFGEYRKKLDSGRRLVIPANLLKSLGEEPMLVGYIKPGENCIRFYDKTSFEEMVEEVVRNADETMKTRLMRHFYVNSRNFELDIRRRIRISDKFCDSTGINSNVVIVGIGTRFEVWDEETYDKAMSVAKDDENLVAPF